MVAARAEEATPDPFQDIRRSTWRVWLWTWCGLLLLLTLIGLAGWALVYSANHSMAAFEQLPIYQVKRLGIDYEEQVVSFERSFAETQALLASDDVRNQLQRARTLAEQVMLGEQDFAEAVAIYGRTMTATVKQAGGALEWNRQLQMRLEALKKRSLARQQNLQAIIDRYPQAPEALPVPDDKTPAQAPLVR